MISPRFRVLALVLVFGLAASIATAREAGEHPSPRPGDPDLREAFFRYFEKRLRIDLGLTDEQVAEVLPRVRAMERERARFLREKRTAAMELRRAYRGGADDAELESLMSRVQEIDHRLRSRMDELMGEVDASLTVRQRVEFRAFLERFRQEMRRRVQQYRQRSGDPSRYPSAGRPTGAPSSPDSP